MSSGWAAVADAGPGWDEIVADARVEVLSTLLGSDVNRLATLFAGVTEASDRDRDRLGQALREVAARVPVYRTYLTVSPRCVPDEDAALIGRAIALATAARPDIDPSLFALLGRVLRLEVDEPRGPGAGDPVPAAHASRHGQGRGGHGLLPAPPAGRAERGRRRSRWVRHQPGRIPCRDGGGGGTAGGNAVAVHARYKAERGRPRPACTAVRGSGGLAGRRRGAWRGIAAAPQRPGISDARGRVPSVPDPDRRMADRHRSCGCVRAEGEPRGQAAHLMDCAGRGLRRRARALRARRARRRRLRPCRGGGRGIARGRGPPRRAWPARAGAHRSRCARPLPGRRAVAAVARGPGQPPAGRLPRAPSTPRRGGRRRCRGGVEAPGRGTCEAMAGAPCPRPAPPARGGVPLERLPSHAGGGAAGRCGRRLRAWRGDPHRGAAAGAPRSSGSAGPTPRWCFQPAGGATSTAPGTTAPSRWPSSLRSFR